MEARSPRKALIVLDYLFTEELAEICLAPLVANGWEIDRVTWELSDIEEQRTQVRRLENEGPADTDTIPALSEVHDYEIIITQFAPISRRAIENGKNLKLIAINRAGIQNLDAAAAKDRNVEIFNVPGRNTNAVAEHTVGLMLAHLRYIAKAHASLKQDFWMEHFEGAGPRELQEVSVGIIGYGLIGRRVHEMLTPFRPAINVYDPFIQDAPAGASLMDLDTLLAQSDVVTVHVPLNDHTRGLIGARELSIMKPDAILVNTARAEIVDQEALRQAISSGELRGAALDVFDSEPLSASDPLISTSSTTVTPHLAGTTRQAFVQGPIWIAERLAKVTG